MSRGKPKIPYNERIEDTRKCKCCGETKLLNTENFKTTLGRDKKTEYFSWKCRECDRKKAIDRRNKNIDKYNLVTKEFFKNNPGYRKKWKKDNKKHVKEYSKKYDSQPHIRIKKSITGAVRKFIKDRNISKNEKIINSLGYSGFDLERHLESLFEPWMSWDNWGNYNPKTWDDSDSSTWTWQIDHIEPLANFSFCSEIDKEFMKAWSLDNLRPYSAKQNILDGCTRVRHKNKTRK